MRRKTTLVVTAGMAVLLATVFVTTGTSVVSTPLFTMRMEQASNDMNFLPTLVMKFSYMTEKGYNMTCNFASCLGLCSGASATSFGRPTCEPVCTSEGNTCDSYTCLETCPQTCTNTCSTCPVTCLNTCPATCPNTCSSTCDDPTCQNTCPNTCTGCVRPTPAPTGPQTCEGYTCQ